jgi:hypothetical protein
VAFVTCPYCHSKRTEAGLQAHINAAHVPGEEYALIRQQVSESRRGLERQWYHERRARATMGAALP